jgi:hypothetical protein
MIFLNWRDWRASKPLQNHVVVKGLFFFICSSRNGPVPLFAVRRTQPHAAGPTVIAIQLSGKLLNQSRIALGTIDEEGTGPRRETDEG